MDAYYGAILLVVLIVLVMYANRDAPGNKNPGKVVTDPDDMAFQTTLTREELTRRWETLQVQIRNTKTSKLGALVDGPITMTSPTQAYFGKFQANWNGTSWSVSPQ